MDLNHDSATDRYTETLNSALNYFSSLAQSNSGWKRLSSASVRSSRPNTSGSNESSSTGTGPRSAPSSPTVQRQNGNNDDLMASLPGGSTPSSAASAAIESLLPSITVAKKSVPGKSAEIVRATIILPGLDEQTDLEDWRAVLECTGARKIWDRMVDSSTVMQTLDDNTCITKTTFKTTWPASPRDALLIETTLLDHNAVLHIATSIKPSHDDPIFLRPSPPYVRAYLPLVAWHIQLVPADLEDTVSFTSFNSLSASQHKPVMPRHSIRVSFYYQIDMRGWAVNSSVSMQSHVPSCIANVYRLLRRQGVPPHVSRHSPRIQLDLNEYDPAIGIYELRYDVIPPDSDDLLLDRKTVSSKLRQFRLGLPLQDEEQESANDPQDPSIIPQELVLSDDDEADEMENDKSNHGSHVGYVDVELDGERWGLGSDIVVHIFMNDIEDEEFVQEHVECLKYMGRDRYILRMRHTDIGSHHGAINVKLRIERIAQHMTGGVNLLTYQQLRIQRQQQEQEQVKDEDRVSLADMNGLVVSVNGHEKDILPFHRSSIQGSKRVGMSLQEQRELSKQIVREVDNSGELNSGSGLDRSDNRTTASPLLLMSSSMPTTMQSLARSSQSIMSNGTSTMAPGNTNPSKVNSSYAYFNTLLLEPPTSWKLVTRQRGVQVSKLEVQGYAPGIVKGEGIFEGYTIWDIKAALDCASARKVWDKMFDESQMLQHATPSSILTYVRLKGFWPSSPKDMAVLNTTFITKDKIHYFATSTDDTTLYPSIPSPVSPFVRSEVVVSGWYLEAIKPKSVRVVHIAQAAPTGWMVPGTALSAMTTEMPLCVAEVIQYLETFGSPPTLVSIRRGRALGIDYSHEKSTFRLEYVQDSNPVFSGHRALQQQQLQQQQLQDQYDKQRRITIDYTAGMGSTGISDSPLFGSPKLGPTDKLLAEIRLDARVWARNGDCDITIDPPPSKVSCTSVPHDGTGYRLRIEHSSGRAVPAGGKVLLMARKPAKPGCGIVVNGVAIKMPSVEHLISWIPQNKSSSPLLLTNIGDSASTNRLAEDEDKDAPRDRDANDPKGAKTAKDRDESEDSTASLIKATQHDTTPQKNEPSASTDTPLQCAQNAMDLLANIMADPEESWSDVSESKGGLRVTKRFMPAEISDQVPLVRGEKVIEGFSQEEIATVIGTLGTRSKLDDLFESGEMLESFGNGCALFHHVLKGYFPLPLPARDLFFVTVTAAAEASARCPLVVIVSTSVPQASLHDTNARADAAALTTRTPPVSNPIHNRPRAHLHISAWILECIDPYSGSHPIPSTRVTFMTALDLGGSVPQRISGMIQTRFPKMITQVENYLQTQAAPPIVRIPEQMILNPHRRSDDSETSDHTLDETLPRIIPWVKPSSRMTSREFKLKELFSEMTMTFDQFQLHPSRLDLALERRSKLVKKLASSSSKDTSTDGSSSGCPNSNGDKSSDGTAASSVSTAAASGGLKESKGARAGDVAGGSSKNRTVVELIVDLKQYPMGYNIMTSIKVDPEFLLQQKQQRDSQRLISASAPSAKFTGSTSLSNLSSAGHGHGIAGGSTTKFIGGFDTAPGDMTGNTTRLSLDISAAEGASKAASSGTGIAAVLGGSSMAPRALPSSTSLIRILPPPITVQVIDIPPAPSHSSSLSGVSKRRKHLIIFTVPEAESSVSHVQAQQQAAAAASAAAAAAATATTSSNLGVGMIRSTGAAKPVVTTNSVTGSTSTSNMVGTEDTSLSGSSTFLGHSGSSHSVSSSLEVDSGTVTIRAKPLATTASPDRSILGSPEKRGASIGPSASGPGLKPLSSPQYTPSAAATKLVALETRMFQFGVKVDQLEHKDLDHAATAADAIIAATDSAEKKEWKGKVMVDGLPVQVLEGWTRQELGFLDGIVDEDENEEAMDEEDRRRTRNEKKSRLQTKDGEENGDYAAAKEVEEETPTQGSRSRRRRHHRQQLAAQNNEEQILDMDVQGSQQSSSQGQSRQLIKEKSADATDTLREIESAEKKQTAGLRPSSSMTGLSNFLVNVGLMSGPKRANTKEEGVSKSHDEYEEQDDDDDDRTIRASKGTQRSGLGSVLSNNSNNKGGSSGRRRRAKKDETNGHDLDLESLHGSIVFRDDGGDETERSYGWRTEEGGQRQTGGSDSEHAEVDGKSRRNGEASRASTIRRRRGNQIQGGSDLESVSDVQRENGELTSEHRRRRHQDKDHGSDMASSEVDGSTVSTHRRNGSSSSRRQRSSSRHKSSSKQRSGRWKFPGSTNGADHPRFRGSHLYAYTFRNLFWSGVLCFVIGLLLRIYVIGPSFLKTVSSSSSSSSSGTHSTYYYYYRTVPRPRTPAADGTDATLSSLQLTSMEDGEGSPGMATTSRDSASRAPQGGIRELFAIRQFMGWDVVLLAYPSEQQSSATASKRQQKQQ
ncbi:hypothetical protein BG004_003787 [Podila humilis]|nr:hypothetical protein BG004_003787 [Podila humilis]